MPLQDLSTLIDTPAPFAVIASVSKTAPTLVDHIGMLPFPCRRKCIESGDEVEVYDSTAGGLRAGGNGGLGRMQAHWYGARDLTPAQILRMDATIKLIRTGQVFALGRRERLRAYMISPAFRTEVRNGVLVGVAFSCAGLVAYCYATVGINLVNLDTLPPVEDTHLETIWGRGIVEHARRFLDPSAFADNRILLPSYICHAMRLDPGTTLLATREHWNID